MKTQRYPFVALVCFCAACSSATTPLEQDDVPSQRERSDAAAFDVSGEIDTAATDVATMAHPIDAPLANSDGQLGETPRNDAGRGECKQLVATVRDFRDSHVDFENPEYNKGLTKNLVKTTLDADKKPVYAHDKIMRITSKETFREWYRDVPFVNMTFQIPLPMLEGQNGFYAFEAEKFFPLNDIGFGNQGRLSNFHFTTEIAALFQYKGGEIFRITGDDDIWVFINDILVIDLGGVHGPMSDVVLLDDLSQQMGFRGGDIVSIRVFHAERQTTTSRFHLETTIDCLISATPNQ